MKRSLKTAPGSRTRLGKRCVGVPKGFRDVKKDFARGFDGLEPLQRGSARKKRLGNPALSYPRSIAARTMLGVRLGCTAAASVDQQTSVP